MLKLLLLKLVRHSLQFWPHSRWHTVLKPSTRLREVRAVIISLAHCPESASHSGYQKSSNLRWFAKFQLPIMDQYSLFWIIVKHWHSAKLMLMYSSQATITRRATTLSTGPLKKWRSSRTKSQTTEAASISPFCLTSIWLIFRSSWSKHEKVYCLSIWKLRQLLNFSGHLRCKVTHTSQS